MLEYCLEYMHVETHVVCIIDILALTDNNRYLLPGHFCVSLRKYVRALRIAELKYTV